MSFVITAKQLFLYHSPICNHATGTKAYYATYKKAPLRSPTFEERNWQAQVAAF